MYTNILFHIFFCFVCVCDSPAHTPEWMAGARRPRFSPLTFSAYEAGRQKGVSVAPAGLCNSAQRLHQSPLHLRTATAFLWQIDPSASTEALLAYD